MVVITLGVKIGSDGIVTNFRIVICRVILEFINVKWLSLLKNSITINKYLYRYSKLNENISAIVNLDITLSFRPHR